ncbi:peptidase dimerization domain-containing protein [Clostridium muellerianum]|uniref:peptidase dimerization domain-containing protein n=1 Tax=Clostridium muellerianum TaxID=2716538 RepID=UPI001FADEC8E|nr:peptidase dimerization domain-containing protein [Clostridium muellerianum]
MNPITCNKTLKLLKGKGRFFEPLLHNTITPTIVKGGKKINVIPQEITLEFDGRILPGYGPDNLKKEIKALLLGREVNIEITNFVKGPISLIWGFTNF